jgi:DNA ligase-1
MRIGLAEKSVQMALAQAAVYSEKGSPPKNVQSPFEEVDALISSIYMLMLISYLSA